MRPPRNTAEILARSSHSLSLLSHFAVALSYSTAPSSRLDPWLTPPSARSPSSPPAPPPLRKLRYAPSARVSGLRCVLSRDGGSDSESHSSSRSGREELVVARGLVEAKSAVKGGTGKCLRHNVLAPQDSGDRAVLAQRIQTCIYNESKGFFGWTPDLGAILSVPCRSKNPPH